MGRLTRKVIATLRSGGLRGLIWQALAVAGVRRLTVYCRPLDDHFAPAATPGVSVRPLSGADADAYRALRPGAPEAELELRLEAGPAGGADPLSGPLRSPRGQRLVRVRRLRRGAGARPRDPQRAAARSGEPRTLRGRGGAAQRGPAREPRWPADNETIETARDADLRPDRPLATRTFDRAAGRPRTTPLQRALRSQPPAGG